MPTQRDRIIEYLLHQREADDDEIARALGIGRHRINTLCNDLSRRGLVEREVDSTRGKLANRLVPGSIPYAKETGAPTVRDDAESLKRPSTEANRPSATSVVVNMRTLSPAAAGEMALTGYMGAVGLSEDRVKLAVATALERAGWTTDVRWGRVHGIDIDARRGAERLVIEAKGEGSLQPMRVNYFVGALGELLQWMNSPDALYAIALPAHRQFVSLAARLPVWVRDRLQLAFLFVEATADEAYDVTLVPPPGSSMSVW
jgi:biotin operon repressor